MSESPSARPGDRPGDGPSDSDFPKSFEGVRWRSCCASEASKSVSMCKTSSEFPSSWSIEDSEGSLLSNPMPNKTKRFCKITSNCSTMLFKCTRISSRCLGKKEALTVYKRKNGSTCNMDRMESISETRSKPCLKGWYFTVQCSLGRQELAVRRTSKLWWDLVVLLGLCS